MPLLYWFLEDIQQTQIAGGFTIVTKSDVACHMWLRHTLMPPQRHAKPVERRGLLIMWDARFCFVAFDDLEQNEAGDTFTHTFTWTGWESCETRYFYFWATNSGEPMHSTSCIFSKHFLYEAVPQTAYFYSDPHPELVTVDGWAGQGVSCPACTWSDVRNGPGSSSADGAPILIHWLYAWKYPGEYAAIYRSILLFDTSTIGQGKTILSARLRVKVNARHLSPDNWAPMLTVVSSLPFHNNDLRSSDYATLGILKLSNARGWAVFVPGITRYFDFNADGLLAIDPEGLTKLGIREYSYDLQNSPPPYYKYGSARIDLYSADNPDEPDKPRLQVTYI